jgi:hypothetical protein
MIGAEVSQYACTRTVACAAPIVAAIIWAQLVGPGVKHADTEAVAGEAAAIVGNGARHAPTSAKSRPSLMD